MPGIIVISDQSMFACLRQPTAFHLQPKCIPIIVIYDLEPDNLPYILDFWLINKITTYTPKLNTILLHLPHSIDRIPRAYSTETLINQTIGAIRHMMQKSSSPAEN